MNRYLQEATAAREWMESFAPVIQAHLDGQEVYDLAQFIVETAIFLAAIALLLRMRLLWYLCIVLGLLGAGTVGRTWLHVSSELRPAEARVEELGDAYRELRNTGKADAADQAFVDQILARRAP